MSSLHSGYRCHLPAPGKPGQAEDSYDYIGFQGWSLHLSVSNFSRARCKLCKAEIQPGDGVERKVCGQCHYICMGCVERIICGHELGFIVTLLFNLQACIMHHGRYSGQVVWEGIRRVSDATLVTLAVEISGERHRKPYTRSRSLPESIDEESGTMRSQANGQQSSDESIHSGPG
jgi:hypothetical protein